VSNTNVENAIAPKVAANRNASSPMATVRKRAMPSP
jgi:hypothetical protein